MTAPRLTSVLTPALTLAPGTPSATHPATPPPGPDRRWRAVLLVLFLTTGIPAVLLPPPTARAASAAAVIPASDGAVPAAAPAPGRAWPVGDRSGLLRRFDAPTAPGPPDTAGSIWRPRPAHRYGRRPPA